AGNPTLLAVCYELGVDEVYRVGGSQAVAALAYGVEGMPAVDMIVGPGNQFVALAKKHVFGQVAIDMLAGPSEVVVLADETAPAAYVAADLIAQAEHAPGASILITWHAPLLDEVEAELERQLARLPRGELARESLESFGALVLARGAARRRGGGGGPPPAPVVDPRGLRCDAFSAPASAPWPATSPASSRATGPSSSSTPTRTRTRRPRASWRPSGRP